MHTHPSEGNPPCGGTYIESGDECRWPSDSIESPRQVVGLYIVKP
jgi:hypothetical protein